MIQISIEKRASFVTPISCRYLGWDMLIHTPDTTCNFVEPYFYNNNQMYPAIIRTRTPDGGEASFTLHIGRQLSRKGRWCKVFSGA